MLVGHKLFKERETIIVVREDDDPEIRSDSGFYFRMRNELMAQGHQVAKALMEHDGYITEKGDRDKYHIRADNWHIHDPRHHVRETFIEYESKGYVLLEIESTEPGVEAPLIGDRFKVLYPEGVALHERKECA